MSVQKALLLELFAIVLVVYGGFSHLIPNIYNSTTLFTLGIWLGAGALVYGLIGDRVVRAMDTE